MSNVVIYLSNLSIYIYLSNLSIHLLPSSLLNTFFFQSMNRAYGSVYKAKHKESGFTMAIKEIVLSNADDLKKEIEILKKCRHSNIVSYYGTCFPPNKKSIWVSI